MSRRALEMEHLSPNRDFVRGTWREGSYAKDLIKRPTCIRTGRA
jgi:hypothetical protein